MNQLDERIRARLAETPRPAVDVVDDLVTVRRQARRRTVRRRVTVALASVMAVALVGAAIALTEVDDEPGSVTTRPRETAPTVPPIPSTDPVDRTSPVVREIAAGQVAAVILSTNGNGGGIALADLGDGAVAEYLAPALPWSRGALGDATITPANQLIVWNAGLPTMVFDVFPPGRGLSPLVRDAGLSNPGRIIGTIGGDRQVVPTSSGTHVWIAGPRHPDNGERPLEYVNVATGSAEFSTTTRAVLPTEGLTLTATVGDDAVLLYASGGGNVWDEVIRIAPNGAQSSIQPPRDGAQFVVMTDDGSVWISADRREVLVQRGGSARSIPAPEPDLVWLPTAHPTIPSNSPPLAMLNGGGSQLLLTLADPESFASPSAPEVEARGRMAVVDLAQASVSVVSPSLGYTPSTAFWAQDGITVLVVGRLPNGDQVLHVLDPVTGMTAAIDGAIPPGYYLLAGR